MIVVAFQHLNMTGRKNKRVSLIFPLFTNVVSNYFVTLVCVSRMKAVLTKQATNYRMIHGTLHLQNLPAFAGRTFV